MSVVIQHQTYIHREDNASSVMGNCHVEESGREGQATGTFETVDQEGLQRILDTQPGYASGQVNMMAMEGVDQDHSSNVVSLQTNSRSHVLCSIRVYLLSLNVCT